MTAIKDYIELTETQLMISAVTDSTGSPLVDKLMRIITTTLIVSVIGQFGGGPSTACPRRDSGAHNACLSPETANCNGDKVNIFIYQEWMERCPLAPDRKELLAK